MRNLLITILSVTLAVAVAAQTTAHAPDQGTVPNPKSTASMQPTATIETSQGEIHCTLFPDKAPETVANFIGLSTGKKPWKDPKTGQMRKGVPLYDGTIFHRVIPNFMIQGGDPTGTGMGDPGYSFKDEFSPDLTFDQPGRLAMANSGPATNGSQFFITEVPTPHLNNKHTIFGQCGDEEVVKKIARVASDPRNDKPFTPVTITHIKIVDPRHPATTTPHRRTGTAAHHTGPGARTTKAAPKKTPPPPQQ